MGNGEATKKDSPKFGRVQKQIGSRNWNKPPRLQSGPSD